ncbi:DNA replication/repair protein RecF [Micrococcales bacterium 31B]|nr:DNA replication/repair protein RecF [Micrococcales bacterium 31B]
MFISHLTLSDYRSYEKAEFSFDPGVTVLVGPNGHGKTNVMEAIGYLATMTSHRVAHDAALVRRGCESAVIRGVVQSDETDERPQKIEVQIIPGRVNRARHQGVARRPRDLTGIVRTVLFAPEDLQLVRGDPDLRRRFLDDLLVLIAPRFAGVKADYDKVVKQRNSLLKSSISRENPRRAGAARRKAENVAVAVEDAEVGAVGGNHLATLASGPSPLSTLSVWDDQLVALGSELTRARIHLVARLVPHFKAAYLRVSEDQETPDAQPSAEGTEALAAQSPAHLRYAARVELPEGEVTPTNPTGLPSQAQVRAALAVALADLRRQELDRGVTLVGPHRDDLALELLDFPVKGYASHGETWSIVLALKLAAFELLRQETASWEAGDPILILDDVFAELDVGRRRRLAEIIRNTQQVLITAAVDEDLPAGLSGAKYGIRRDDGISAVVCA